MTAVLSNPLLLVAWGVLVFVSVLLLVFDLSKRNAAMGGLMKWVWGLTVLYSGPLGLAVYWYSGRSQIARDSLCRRSFRSVAHCYSGCGAGEVLGVILTAGVLSLGTWWIAGVSFLLAYVAGFGLTVGPLVQEGVGVREAVADAFWSETASITVMEVTAIGADLMLAGTAVITDPLFWSSLVMSLSLGLLAAYPVNVLLISLGVKEGMHSPRETAAGSG